MLALQPGSAAVGRYLREKTPLLATALLVYLALQEKEVGELVPSHHSKRKKLAALPFQRVLKCAKTACLLCSTPIKAAGGSLASQTSLETQLAAVCSAEK